MDNNTIDWLKNDSLFMSELKKGQKWERYVCDYLRKKGVLIQSEDHLNENSTPRLLDYVDENTNEKQAAIIKSKIVEKTRGNSKDIVLWPNVIIEVKSKNRIFNGIEDYPFDTVFMDTVSSYDKKNPKPILYICVSQKTGAMIATRGMSNDMWTKNKTFDTVRRIHDTFYESPKELWRNVDFYIDPFIEWQQEEIDGRS